MKGELRGEHVFSNCPGAWNRFGTKVAPKLRFGDSLTMGVEFSVSVDATQAHSLQTDIQQALADLGLSNQVEIELSQSDTPTNG